MPDYHYHANHVDAPARGSKAAAMKDARRLRLHAHPDDGWLVDPAVVSAETMREHGIEFPLLVRCWRSDCTIRRDA